ncbi:MAG: hypothetical protein AAF483_04420, partial [Planctomycetota bacterium]
FFFATFFFQALTQVRGYWTARSRGSQMVAAHLILAQAFAIAQLFELQRSGDIERKGEEKVR